MAKQIVRSPVTGTVWKIEAAAGDAVEAGTTLVILESMKMEVPVDAPAAGTLVTLKVGEGETVEEDQELAVIEA